jgi:sulfatase maturation enzyme AslB (radical SAM superfamily)
MTVLTLILTRDCNLHCPYCYQKHSSCNMQWNIAQTAVEIALSSPSSDYHINLFGGEPLLNWDVICRLVEHVEKIISNKSNVKFALWTNGILLDNDKLDFIASHEIYPFISFKGANEAKTSPLGFSFADFDRVLRSLVSHPANLASRTTIQMVAHDRNINYLADSYRYLCDRGVNRIFIEGNMLLRSESGKDFLQELELQMDQIFRHSLELYSCGKHVPLAYLQTDTRTMNLEQTCQFGEIVHCDLFSPNWKVVDVNGDLYSCSLLIDGFTKMQENGPLPQVINGIRIGNLHNPSCIMPPLEYLALVEQRLGPYLYALTSRRGMHASCIECKYASTCIVCPLCTFVQSDESHSPVVPEHLCHISWLVGKLKEEWQRCALHI